MRLAICVSLVAALVGVAAPAAGAHSGPHDRVVIAGGTTVRKDETVRTVVVVDGPVKIAGRVTKDLVVVHGRTTISGSVGGTVTAVSERARLLPGARVGGDLLYGDEKPSIASCAHVDGKVRDEGWSDVGKGPFQWLATLVLWLGVTVSTLVLGFALLGLAPRAAEAASRIAAERTTAAAIWATVLFFGLPLAVVLLIGSVFGIPLGLALLLALVPLAAIGYVTSCWVVGRRVVRGNTSRFVVFLAGWGILRAIALVPFLGVLVWIVASAFGLGLLLLAAWYGGAEGRDRPAQPPPPPAAQPAA